MNNFEISAAILAGGKSSRFGEPKENAIFENATLLEHAIRTARKVSSRICIISGSNGYPESNNIEVYQDLFPDCGPLGGIYTALYHSGGKYVAILPCDMPFLNERVYQILLERADDMKPAVALSGKGMEPLVSLWPAKTFSLVLLNLLQNRFSVRNVLSKMNAIQVKIPFKMLNHHPDLFLNINYKSDLNICQTSTPPDSDNLTYKV